VSGQSQDDGARAASAAVRERYNNTDLPLGMTAELAQWPDASAAVRERYNNTDLPLGMTAGLAQWPETVFYDCRA
jgi:hypothetical protein